MQRFTEGDLALLFADGWAVSKYDGWAFYRNQFEKCCGGNKAVDFLAFDPATKTLWLIELKDYRRYPRTKPTPLWDEVATKARDSLAGLVAAQVAPGHAEQAFARKALGATRMRIVLHLEPETTMPEPRRVVQRSLIQQKLKQLAKAIDAHPLVAEMAMMQGVPWAAEGI